MRPFEIIIPILLVCYLIWKRPRPLGIRMLPAVTSIIVLLHLITEGYRWQMIPLYLLTGILALCSVFDVEVKRFGAVLILFLLAISTALPVLLPVPSIPASNGPYQVGTRIYELTDASRQELYSGKQEAREFQI